LVTPVTLLLGTIVTPSDVTLSYKNGEFITVTSLVGSVPDASNYFVAQVILYVAPIPPFITSYMIVQPVAYQGGGLYSNFMINLSGVLGATGPTGAASTAPSTVTGPTGPTGAASTVTGPTGPSGAAYYVPYTPTTNITLGTGGTIVGMYAQQGELTNVYVHITLGSSAFTMVTGPTVSLPVTANNMTINSNTGIALNGIATFVDTSVPQSVYGIITYNTTLDVEIRPYLSSGNYQVLGQLTPSVPFTWASGDEIFIIFSYHSVPPP
jgi:hypothetical protein